MFLLEKKINLVNLFAVDTQYSSSRDHSGVCVCVCVRVSVCLSGVCVV